jgi:hypothetical protein
MPTFRVRRISGANMVLESWARRSPEVVAGLVEDFLHYACEPGHTLEIECTSHDDPEETTKDAK